MKLNDLRPDKGSTKNRRRVGRGISAGKGKTAGRGTKGQGARSGGGKPPYFEGGQLPLVRRLPFKRGFTNIFRINYQEVNVRDLQEKSTLTGEASQRFEDGTVVTPEVLEAEGLIRDALKPVKILGDGELSTNLTVHAHGFTKSAQEKIEDAGGSVEKLELLLTGAAATVKKPKKEVLERLRAERENK
jgi:large subunit ribosomal protein L15